MLAKAIAKESGATFVNVSLSSIMVSLMYMIPTFQHVIFICAHATTYSFCPCHHSMPPPTPLKNKWFGESNKLISATFNLARKLAPSVIFIDEMDSFLSQRDSTEGSAVNSMKSEFLTLWDGLLSERKNQSEFETPILPQPPIIVLGATNRPYDVDPAILRRLPRSFEIALPNNTSRLQLLNLFLQKQSMTREAEAYVTTVAKLTEGYSGSDLKEVCRAAAWEPVRQLTTGASQKAVGVKSKHNKKLKRTSSGFPPRGTKARPVNVNDFDLALRKVKKTGDSAQQFHKQEFIRGREDRRAMEEDINRMTGNSDPTPQQVDVNQLMAAALAAMSSVQNGNRVNGQRGNADSDDEPPEMFVDASS